MKVCFKIAACVALLAGHHLFWRARTDEIATRSTTLGTEVDDIVGHLDDIHVMFDDDDGVAALDKRIEAGEETTDVMEVTVEHLSPELMDHLVRRIIAEVPGINRVLYDFTPKPPATVEYE